MRESIRFFERGWRLAWAALLWAVVAAVPMQAHAHKASDAYLQLARAGDLLSVRWDIALRDLDAVLDLDADGDRKLTWGEVRSRMPDIQAYSLSRLTLQEGRCALAVTGAPQVEDRIDGAYLVLQLQGRCDPRPILIADYRLFREVDPTHRGLLRIEGADGAGPVVQSLNPAGGPVSIAWAGQGAEGGGGPSSFFEDGVHHIVIGYDHVLFLIALMLPVVLRRTGRAWTPVSRFREAAWPIFGMVTMFTIAHSFTLALAGLKLIALSPRVIEPAIALTIMVAALDNLVPILRGRRKLFAFLFGLIHGFGFAGVLGELNLPASGFVTALLQFNVGVEVGQLAIVMTALCVLFAIRAWPRYPAIVLRGGAMAAFLLAAIWLVERVFDLKILDF